MATTVDQKLLKQTKFPAEFSQKVDMKKVNIEVMKKWIAEKISEILGNEDDVVIELCFNLLEGARFPDIKVLQIQLTGFLEKDTPAFCKELWTLCLSAQANPQGVPKELLEAKKLELIQEKILSERAIEEAQRRREHERTRERELDNIRSRERGERGRGRFRGGRGGRDYDRRPQRDSRSPPRRRNSNEYRPSGIGRDSDTYIPHESRRRNERPRHRSPPSRVSRSRSRSLKRSSTPPRRPQRRSASRSRSLSRSPPARYKRRSLSRSRSISPMPSRRRHRDSPSPVRSRSRRRSRDRYRDRKPDGASGRSDDRVRRTSVEKSHSRSPRRHRNGRKPSRSLSSSSRSPGRHSRHKRRRRSSSFSRSQSPRPRSVSPRRFERSGRSHRSIRSPSADRDNRTDTRKERNRDLPRQRRNPSSDRSKSPPAKKRRQSIERYVPGSRRERNTSSPEDHDEE